jgi:hypothetical protein
MEINRHDPILKFKWLRPSCLLHPVILILMAFVLLCFPFSGSVIYGNDTLSIPHAYAQPATDSGKMIAKYGDKSYEITIALTNGQVLNATVLADDEELLLDLEPSQDEWAQLTITLPRELIDARTADLSDDEQFTIVFSDSEGTYAESNSTSAARTLSIDIPPGTEYLSIVGTHVVPEFPPLAILIAGVAILSILGLRRRARIGLS